MAKAEASQARIFLVGFMGSGKSTVGRLLAGEMSFDFIDLDGRVEVRAGRSIARIFADSGEAEFRRLERRALADAVSSDRVVVATGGGTFVSAENRDLIAGSGVSVWLNPDFPTLERRVLSEASVERPLFADPARAAELFESRREAYGQADRRIDVAPDEPPQEVVRRILRALPEGPCAT